MTTKGTLKADALKLGKLEISWLQSPMKLTVLAALVNESQGSTHAWLDGTGIQWSKETKEALDALKEAIERDLAATHFVGGSETTTLPSGLRMPTAGLGEHLGAADDAPSV
jgi:hypothetical protein